MPGPDRSQPAQDARRDAGAFGAFYARHVHAVLREFAVQVGDPQLAADLVAETFAAALIEHEARPDADQEAQLQRIAAAQLAAARRSGGADDRARRRLGLSRLLLSPAEAAAIQALAASAGGVRVRDVRARVVEWS